jgi:hypothetical protein
LDVFQHRWDLDLVGRDVNDDVILPYADSRDARQVCQLIAVRVPDLRNVVEVLVSLPEIPVVYYAIRPSEPGGIPAY